MVSRCIPAYCSSSCSSLCCEVPLAKLILIYNHSYLIPRVALVRFIDILVLLIVSLSCWSTFERQSFSWLKVSLPILLCVFFPFDCVSLASFEGFVSTAEILVVGRNSIKLWGFLEVTCSLSIFTRASKLWTSSPICKGLLEYIKLHCFLHYMLLRIWSSLYSL